MNWKDSILISTAAYTGCITASVSFTLNIGHYDLKHIFVL